MMRRRDRDQEVWVGSDSLLHTVCIFCDEEHTGQLYADLHDQMMKCRERANPRKRGDLEAYTVRELNRPARPAVIPPMAS